MNDFFTSVVNFIKTNKAAVLCALGGALIGVLFLTLGFFKTLLIVAMTAGGAACGIYIDRYQKRKDQQQEFGRFRDE